jgi:hypothetical protein
MRKINTFLVLIMAALPLSAFAHGTKVHMTKEAIGAALEKFQKDEPARIVEFTGAKGWPDGNGLKVKVYLTKGTVNDTLNYNCGEMTMGGEEMMMCDRAP